jgi:hypothetical protein
MAGHTGLQRSLKLRQDSLDFVGKHSLGKIFGCPVMRHRQLMIVLIPSSIDLPGRIKSNASQSFLTSICRLFYALPIKLHRSSQHFHLATVKIDRSKINATT